MKDKVFLILASIFVPASHAEIINIPKETGFSGFIMGGASYINYSSNLYKGQSDSNDEHSGLYNEPKNRSTGVPLLGLDLRYTFADSRTQIFFGNLIQDAVQFDFTEQLGVRQEIGDKGIVALSYVFPLMPTETWSDPYASGNRDDTDIKSGGVRFAWDKIWATRFNATLTYRKFDIDEEKSGDSLALDTDQQALLDRNGNLTSMSVAYNWVLNSSNIVTPQLIFGVGDFDGKAMSYDRTAAKVSYLHIQNQWTFATNIYAGKVDYDRANPVFGKRIDTNEFGVNASFFLNSIFGVEDLTWLVSGSYAVSDSDIDFFKKDMNSVSTALVYDF